MRKTHERRITASVFPRGSKRLRHSCFQSHFGVLSGNIPVWEREGQREGGGGSKGDAVEFPTEVTILHRDA